MANPTTLASMKALDQYNSDFSAQWDFGTNWSNVATDFETFVNKYLFPKLNETAVQAEVNQNSPTKNFYQKHKIIVEKLFPRCYN